MSRFFRICFLCLAGAVLFLLGMVCSFYLFVVKNDNPGGTIHNTELVTERNTELPQNVAVSSIPTVDKSTEYVIIKENTITGETEEVVEEIPASLVGMSRDEIEEYLAEYELSPGLADRQDGFVSASVESYSADRLVIQKVYEPLHEIERFFLKAEENYVVIYYADQSTVYMYTSIRMDTLPEETRKDIEDDGKEIDSLEKLYSFLESYTS